MADWKTKVIFLIKPTQSRKTQETIDRIKKEHNEIGNFFIYFCHNVLIAKNQTRARIIKELTPQEDVIYINDSDNTTSEIIALSSEEGDFGTRAEVVEHLLNNDVSGLCLLVHPVRFKKRVSGVSDIQGLLQSIQNINRIGKVSIYFDEFDKYSEQLIKNIEMFTTFSKVVKIELVSATYVQSKFIKWYGDVPMEQIVDYRELGSYDKNLYVTYDDIQKADNLHSYEYHGDWFDFVIKYIVLFQLEKEFYGFIPAPIKRTKHLELVKAVNELGISVILYNSDFKHLFIPGQEPIPIPIYAEQTTAIKYMKDTYNIKKLVVTGNICVGRAVTLMNPVIGLVFDFAIYHEDIASSGDQLYQLDRTKGHIKGGKLPHIVCTKKVEKRLIEAEKYAFIGESTSATLLEYVQSIKDEMNPIQESDWTLLTEEFTDRKLANEFLISNDCRRNNKETRDGDFMMSSTTKEKSILLYSTVIHELKSLKNTALFDVKKSLKIGTKHSRMIICYKNITDASTICYIVRIIEKVK